MIAELGYKLLVYKTNEFSFQIFRAMQNLCIFCQQQKWKFVQKPHKKSFLHLSKDLGLCSRLSYVQVMSMAQVWVILMLEYSYVW
jgi:hypothetical protein